MSLRCFVKRWLGYPLDMPLAMMLSPGAIGILRYVAFFIPSSATDWACQRTRSQTWRSQATVQQTDNETSYLKHDIEQPAFFVGMSLPPL